MAGHNALQFAADPNLCAASLPCNVLAALEACTGEKHAAAFLMEKKVATEQAVSLIVRMRISHISYTIVKKTFPQLPPLCKVKQCMKDYQPDLQPVYVMVKKKQAAAASQAPAHTEPAAAVDAPT